ncbi:MAG: hypothetical protein GF355_08850, partial [Candidatus Eisenbacteria bacterium]|nr:hypothetical protein [Candidatus Eisenbacteria bacterium]
MKSKNAASAPPIVALLALVIFLGPAVIRSAEAEPLEALGAWSFGGSSAVAYDAARDIVFLGSGGVVLALDVADMTDPQLISDEINTMGLVTGLRYDAAAQRLLVAAGLEDLQIWDVQDPAAPVRLSVFEVEATGINPPVGNVDLYGDFALVEVAWIGAASIDISDPQNPVLVDINKSAGSSTTDLHVSPDGYLHVVGSEYYGRIHIEGDGSLPGLSHFPNGNARVVFATEYAAFIERYGDLRIIDYGEGDGSLTDVGYFYDMVVDGDLAYLGGGSQLMIYDVSNLEQPAFVGSVDAGTEKLDVSGSYAYLARGSDGLRAVNVSDPANPKVVGTYPTYGSSRSAYVDGDYAYVAQGTHGVVVIDASDLAQPHDVGKYETPGIVQDVMVAGGYAYVADDDGGLRIADVSDPTNPTEISVTSIPGASLVDVSAGRAYVIDDVLNEPDILRIFDVSDPSLPAELGSHLFESSVSEIAVSGEYLYAAAEDSGLIVVDVTDPAAPLEVGSYLAENVRDVSVREDHAFVASTDWDGGFMIFDVADPADPTLIGNYVPNSGWYHPFDMAVSGNFAYLADPTSTSGSVVMLNIGDPTMPVELAAFTPPGDVRDLIAVDSLLYICDGDAGFRIVENQVYSDPGGGVSWVEQQSGTDATLRAVHFVSPTLGWVAGEEGTILKTEDGGLQWLPLASGTDETFFALHFFDENTGFAGGRDGLLTKTTDGGETWVAQGLGIIEDVRDFEFLDADLGWLVGGGG